MNNSCDDVRLCSAVPRMIRRKNPALSFLGEAPLRELEVELSDEEFEALS